MDIDDLVYNNGFRDYRCSTLISITFLLILVMMFNATFNNISVLSYAWWSVLLVEEVKESHIPVASQWSLTNIITESCIEYSTPWTGFELTNLVVIVTSSSSNTLQIASGVLSQIDAACPPGNSIQNPNWNPKLEYVQLKTSIYI